MIERFLYSLRNYSENHYGNSWFENHCLYFAIVGGIAAVVLAVVLMIRVYRDIKKSESNIRKSQKHMLRDLSNKENKTN